MFKRLSVIGLVLALVLSQVGAVQFSVAVRNARLDAIETAIGTAAVLKGWTGSAPANCAAADTGTLVFNMTLPSDWMNAASGGTKTLLGVWQDTSADSTNTPGYFRIYSSDGTTCGKQGTVTATGGGGDLTLDDVTIDAGQQVTITTYTLTEGNS